VWSLFVAGISLAVIIGGLLARSRFRRLPFWAVMAFASFIVVAGGLVPVDGLGQAVDIDVILFLIGMFSIVSLAESSGLLDAVAYWFLARVGSVWRLFIVLSIVFGLLAAVTVNDAVAVLGTVMVGSIARVAGLGLEPFLFMLAFSVTIGSVATPIGNPQNVLIAVQSGMKAPLLSFLRVLLLPSLINLLVVPLVLFRWFKISDKKLELLVIPGEAIRNRRDAMIAAIGLTSVVALLLANDALSIAGLPHVENIGFIPFIVAAATYIFVSDPRGILEKVNWGTIVFFIAMFITMKGVWSSGLLQPLVAVLMDKKLYGLEGIAAISVGSLALSQLLSNVPFTQFFIQYMKTIGYTPSDVWAWLVLACSSTIAGNLTLLGAASNIIIMEVAEERYSKSLGFKEFAKLGTIVTAINMAIYLPFLYLAVYP
jgi:Na+/H+ antiporter NhaD/arsenite permease-like protein